MTKNKDKQQDPYDDSISIHQEKGTWKRFFKLFFKCNMPWLWLAGYIAIRIAFANVGVNVTDYTAQLFAGDVSAALVTTLIFTMIAEILLSSITTFAEGITSARISRNMQLTVLEKVLRLPMNFFKDENPRDTIYRIVNNSSVIESSVMFFFIPLFTGLYTMFLVFSRVYKYDWRLSAVMLAFIPLVILVSFIFGRIQFVLNRKISDLDSSLTQKLAEMLMNIPLAKAFARERYENSRGEEITQRLYRVNIKSCWMDQLKDLSDLAVSLLQSAVITFVGLALLGSGDIDKRAWVAFFMFSGLFMDSITDLANVWANVKTIQGTSNRLSEIMDTPEQKLTGKPCGRLDGNIEVRDLHFGYVEDKEILHGVNCTFKHGKITALLGESGCGKTTLMNLLCRMYDPGSGEIIMGNENIAEYALDDYRKNLAVVSQNTMLFSGTIRENVLYGNRGVDEASLMSALEKAGALPFISELPEGLDTVLEEYGSNLSGGQRQKLCIARNLLSDAPCLILDEPVSAIDAVATAEILRIVKESSGNRCVIVIGHTPAVLAVADEVVVIEDGVVSVQGTVDEAKEKSAFLRDFMREEV